MTIEKTILKNLCKNEDFTRKVIPFLKEEYFSESSERIAFGLITDYFNEYNNLPSSEALSIELQKKSTPESLHAQTESLIQEMKNVEDTEVDWLVNETEKFCQDRAVYNAIMSSISIIDDKKPRGEIPQILTEALGVSFDNNVGHDFIENADERYEFYHRTEDRVPFDLEGLNKITKGGLPNKTLNIIMAGTGVGKSLAMCHMASANLLAGKNVLYITMEMAEEKIAERIDANVLNVPIPEIPAVSLEVYNKKINRIKHRTDGKLIVKEYPTASAGAGHFRHLLNELKQKKNFKPDIIYIDYLNICVSMRVKQGNSVNSYTYVKNIAEELRGLAVEKNVPIVSATQTTRSGFGNSDPGLEDTSESFGLPATADFMIALVSSEQLDSLNQIMVKQLKNRYGDPSYMKRFVLGVDRSKMRLFDVDESEQGNVQNEDVPVMDNTGFNKRMEEDAKGGGRNKFQSFNF